MPSHVFFIFVSTDYKGRIESHFQYYRDHFLFDLKNNLLSTSVCFDFLLKQSYYILIINHIRLNFLPNSGPRKCIFFTFIYYNFTRQYKSKDTLTIKIAHLLRTYGHLKFISAIFIHQCQNVVPSFYLRLIFLIFSNFKWKYLGKISLIVCLDKAYLDLSRKIPNKYRLINLFGNLCTSKFEEKKTFSGYICVNIHV